MPVTTVNTLAKGTWGPKTSPGWNREYQITKEAITNDATDSGITVLSSPLLPELFSGHPDDVQARCINIEPEQDEDDATYWVITYRYSTRVQELAQGKPDGSNQDNPTQPQNPLDRKPKVRIAGKMFKKLTFRDLDGNAIANTAGSPYEGTLLEVPRAVIHVTRNIPGFDYNLVNECKGGVNLSLFLNYDPRRVKCEELTADEKFEFNTYYWEVKGEFIVGNDDDLNGLDASSGAWWFEWKLNAGYEYLNASGDLTSFFVNGGQRPARPVLLRQDGTLLNGNGRWIPGGEPPWMLGFRVLRDAPFNALGLFD